MDDRSLRAAALEIASRSGLTPQQTLESARSFYNFLSGKEPRVVSAKPAAPKPVRTSRR